MESKTIGKKKYISTGEWCEIEYTQNEDDSDEMTAYFVDTGGNKHDINNYVKTNSVWNNEPECYAAGLHARDITQYFMPDYIELDETCSEVKNWKEI